MTGDNMSLQDLLNECDELYGKEDYEGLLVKSEEVLEEFPDNPNAIGYKGFALYAFGRDSEALEVLKKGVGLYPDNHYLKSNLALVYYAMGEYETSLKLCDEGLEIKDFDAFFTTKFKCLVKLGMIDEAIDFNEAFGEHLALPVIFLEDDMRAHELDYYSRILERNPDDFEATEKIEFLKKND
jgi:tetratricopeptide (TPR) repeat protein